ncbi:MAG TPA: DUF4388 domain-containing protein, partial [Myxococcota bacterium]|nr:DUF4388 domain-containing protein [Myxococcota bacterium]
RISFVNGDVVRAESSTRKKKDLLGAMLVRAGVIGAEQLESALETQKRTLRRLGDVLVEQLQVLTRQELKQFTQLQTTETLYQLFNWENGTYAFEAEEVNYDRDSVDPIRSENVLMEGFRMVDEWPMIRKRITSYDLTFKKLKELPGSAAKAGAAEADVDGALDNMFGEGGKKSLPKGIGASELKVFSLLTDDRDVQKLIDLSRLGEFETCKALLNLVEQEYIKVAGRLTGAEEAPRGRPGGTRRAFPFGRLLIQLGMYFVVVGVLLVLYKVLGLDPMSVLDESGLRRFQDPAARELMDDGQRERLRNALELYRLELGHYPEKLAELVDAGLVAEGDLRFPWRQERIYRREGSGYLILRPFE